MTGSHVFVRPLYITAQAVVNGATRKAIIGGTRMGRSPFGDFALSGNSAATSGGAVAFGMTGSNNVVNVEGVVETNGGVRGSSYTLTSDMAMSFGTSTKSGSFTGERAHAQTGIYSVPTVYEVGRMAFGLGSSDSVATYLAKNNDNANIRPWNSKLGIGRRCLLPRPR